MDPLNFLETGYASAVAELKAASLPAGPEA